MSSEQAAGELVADLVSIVVPCFDVAEYLDEALQSACAQTHANIEVVVVDDGSTDDTPAVIAEWVSRDDRVTAIRLEHGGLGRARNAGISRARGGFLFFLDGDDLVPPDAIERLLRSMTASGSDFASGVAERFDDRESWRSALYGADFDEDRRGTHLRERPGLVADHIVCSKLFRRSFWEASIGSFPEGVLFEDIELVTRAHWTAQRVDLVSTPTYRWRLRTTGAPSITQDRLRAGSMRARFAALARVDEFLRDNATERVWAAHATKVMTVDVPMYLRLVTAGEGLRHFDEFASLVQEFHDAMAPGIGRDLPESARLVDSALRRRDHSTLQALGKLGQPRSMRSVSLRSVLRTVPNSARAGILRVEVRRIMRGLRIRWRSRCTVKR